MGFRLPLVVALLSLTDVVLSERVLGAYIFQQHGDRTAKFRAPVALTEQGEAEQYMTGLYFRDRYLSSGSQYRIESIKTDVSLKQIVTRSPKHDMMINSGNAFLRGLYPPANHPRDKPSSESMGDLGNHWQVPEEFVWTRGEYLPNPTNFEPPEDAPESFSMRPDQVDDGADLSNVDGCQNAKASKRRYAESDTWADLMLLNNDFYQSLYPLVQGTLNTSQLTYANAYPIWDLFNSELNRNPNLTISTSSLSSSAIMQQLSVLAYHYKLDLVHGENYIRAVGGYAMVANVVSELTKMVKKKTSPKLRVEIGPPETFLSYYGINGMSDYANSTIDRYSSSMVWEIFTHTLEPEIPSEKDIYVRFLAHDGASKMNSTRLELYSILGMSEAGISWKDFVYNTRYYMIEDSLTWCLDRGNTQGPCKKVLHDHDGEQWLLLIVIYVIAPATSVIVGVLFAARHRLLKYLVRIPDFAKELGRWSLNMTQDVATWVATKMKMLCQWISITMHGVSSMLKVLVGFIFQKIRGKTTTMGVAKLNSSSIEMEVKNDSKV